MRDSYSRWSFVYFCFQLKQNQIMLFGLLFLQNCRQGFTCLRQTALSIMLGTEKRVKKMDVPEFSDCYPEPCRSLSPFFLLSTPCPSHLAVLTLFCLWSARQIFVVLDTNKTCDKGLMLVCFETLQIQYRDEGYFRALIVDHIFFAFVQNS